MTMKSLFSRCPDIKSAAVDSSAALDDAAAAAAAPPPVPQGPTVNPASGVAAVTTPGGAAGAQSLAPPAPIVSHVTRQKYGNARSWVLSMNPLSVVFSCSLVTASVFQNMNAA